MELSELIIRGEFIQVRPGRCNVDIAGGKNPTQEYDENAKHKGEKPGKPSMNSQECYRLEN
jgi:hypothetical protein